MLQATSPTGCDRIQQEMKLLKDELSSLHETTAEMISSLEANMVGLEEYHTDYAQFEQWLDEVEERVKVTAQQFDLNAPEQLETDLEVCVCVFYKFRTFLVINIWLTFTKKNYRK